MEILLKILDKKIPSISILFLFAGVLIGAVFSFKLPSILEAHTQKALNWDELEIKTEAEEDAIAASYKAASYKKEVTIEDYGTIEEYDTTTSLTPKKKFDGPSFSASMPVSSKSLWLEWMKSNMPGETEFLEKRWKLANSFIATGELKRWEDVHAFLLTPPRAFCACHE
ncbi:MAG: hypothetical protein Ta2G_20970 [Termitinemataceae bacterium]|nr:MAG: hypothetical protein Ta2G_20970 [Termitinemataceae bacterium]